MSLEQKIEKIESYLRLAEAGDADAMFLVGTYYQRGNGVPLDFRKAMEWYSQAAELGQHWAICCIGDIYANGYGVE